LQISLPHLGVTCLAESPLTTAGDSKIPIRLVESRQARPALDASSGYQLLTGDVTETFSPGRGWEPGPCVL